MKDFARNPSPVVRTIRHLPHWEQAGATYFITFRLADSIPKSKLNQWRTHRDVWLRNHPKPWSPEDYSYYYEEFQQRLERWADRGYGECILKQADLREFVSEALNYFNEATIVETDTPRTPRYRLGKWVIMPNHVHLLVTPAEGWKLGKILHTWKSLSAKRMNAQLRRSGIVWMDERYDHIVRNRSSLRRIERYITDNPDNAFLRAGDFLVGGDAEN